MRGKLSWMTFAIIGGAIVSVVLIGVYFFMVKGVIVSQLTTGSIKPWSTLIMKVDEAAKLGSSVATQYSVGFQALTTILYPDCNTANPVQTGKYPTSDQFNAIWILNKSEVNYFLSSAPLTRSSLSQLSICKGAKYCYCAVLLELSSGYTYKYITLSKETCISTTQGETGYLEKVIPSIIVNTNLDNCAKYVKVSFLACNSEEYPLFYNGKSVSMLQFFSTRTLFLNKLKMGNDYVISMNFIDPQNCGKSSCELEFSGCPFVSK